MPKGQANATEVIGGWPMKKKKESTTETLYHCIHRGRKLGCHASFAVDKSNGTLRVIRDHSRHEEDEVETQMELVKSELRENAKTSTHTSRAQYNQIRSRYSAEVIVRAGDYNSMRKIVERARMEDPDRRSVDNECKVVGSFAITADGEPFIIHEEAMNNKKIIVFSSPKGLELLSASNVLFVDGTFDCTPTGFYQLFSFHVYLSESVVRPVAYALLPSKELSCYEAAIKAIRINPLAANWVPKLLLCDFEINIRRAFASQFPNIQIHACYFHLMQSWRRKATKLNIYTDMMSGGALRPFWNLLRAIPFAECVITEYYFQLITNSLPANNSAKEFIAYLDKYYISGTGGNPPTFPPEIWSCAGLSENAVHRTTNAVEVWHRMLSSVVYITNGLRQVRLSDLIMKLKEEDVRTKCDADALKINKNHQVSSCRKTSNVLKDQRLVKALKNKPTPPNLPLTGLDYLRSISLAIKP
ncbi:unnamed protein product [Caenorhabditis sp. 36 PRJEB53466]|nr:unnamed protein product [Caenorhabditis sp. 36 PRJEB53466]